MQQLKEEMRIYAIGDIHGCDDLLARMLNAIREDVSRRPASNTHCIVTLGDLVDRGPSSRQVIDRLLEEQAMGTPMIHLRGNHDDWMLQALDETTKLAKLSGWWMHGGLETMKSYGVSSNYLLHEGPNDRALKDFRQAVPARHRELLAQTSFMLKVGRFAFVHAGIRPGVALADQDPSDLMWIREPFLSSNMDHDARIVHGHTPRPALEVRYNRVGIDFGAFKSGRLACLVCENGTFGVILAERDGHASMGNEDQQWA